MIKAVLFDLDNTLLHNPALRFVKSYVQALTPHVHAQFPAVDKPVIQNALREAIEDVIADQNPLTTNWEVFMTSFSKRTTIDEASLRSPLDGFYQAFYPELRSLVEPMVSAPRLVRWLFDNGYAVAVTTNPVFETSPIHQRLSWASLDPAEWPFAYITTMQTTHFTKPNPHYYEEVLARIGVEPEETLVIGDDWGNDIVPATRVGMNTFWIETEEQMLNHPVDTPDIQADGQGSLDDLSRMVIDEQWLDTLIPRPLTVAQIEPRLIGNLAALIGMASEIPDHYWHQRPDVNEWSPIEIVTHLYESERTVQRPRLERILQENNPFLSAAIPPPPPGQMALPSTDGNTITRMFAEERQQTIELLASLQKKDWKRPARHSVLGPTTLLEMAAFTTRHDHLHIQQLCQTLGKCE